MRKEASIFISVLTLFTSCGGDTKNTNKKVFDINVTMEKNDFVNIETTRKQFNAHSGEYFSSIDSVTQYGAGYVKQIDDSLNGYAVDIYLSAFIREKEAPLEGGVAVAIFTPSGIKDWKLLRPKTFKPNEWCQVTDTIRYRSTLLNQKGTEIKIFSVKSTGTDFLDIDDIKIKYIFHK